MVSAIKNNPFDADEHLFHFSEFCKGVQATGGTTPHMLMAVEAANRREDIMEKLWIGGCYAFVYNIPTAEILWQAHPYDTVRNVEHMEAWLKEHWKGIKLRKERKAVRSPNKLAVCMTDYRKFMDLVPERNWFLDDTKINDKARYDFAFQDLCDNVKYMGRYIAIRWVEFIRHAFNKTLIMPNIHPKDGEHPRKALALMYPDYHDELMHGNDPVTLDIVNSVVEYCKEDLLTLYQTDVDYYTLQSLLCEYKQSVLAGKQYPGKSIDTELSYLAKLTEYWGDISYDEEGEAEQTEFYSIRRAIFPSFSLGEEQGWYGVRNELGEVLRTYGYTWSDSKYDYIATKESGDFSNPVLRNEN